MDSCSENAEYDFKIFQFYTILTLHLKVTIPRSPKPPD
jgi:hypothetical protein